MKQISFVVPCYNSEAYMKHAIDSILIGKDKVEIIIIDDGSKDNTLKIAKEYETKYPNIIKVHSQENGGHGEGINQGLKLTSGRYFKILDSDDWFDEEAYKKLLSKIDDINSDLIVTNYVYTYTDKKSKPIRYNNVFKENQEITWDDTNNFKFGQYLMIHSIMVKKDILDKANINLPKHTAYEDNLFLYLALYNTKTIYYLNLDLYKYFIGRADQSVSANQMKKNVNSQLLVTKLVFEAYDLDDLESKKLYKHLLRECSLLVSISTTCIRLNKFPDENERILNMWKDLEKSNPKIYNLIRYKITNGSFVSLPGKIGRFIGVTSYKIMRKIKAFN